jgi:hypothetical protein
VGVILVAVTAILATPVVLGHGLLPTLVMGLSLIAVTMKALGHKMERHLVIPLATNRFRLTFFPKNAV